MHAPPGGAINRDADDTRWSRLMSAAHTGDRVAYEQLMTELGDVIAAYLRSRFGNIDTLEDCVQESLLAIHRARHTYNPKRAFRPWMFTIVKHKTIDVLRRQPSGRRETAAREPVAVGNDSLMALEGARLLAHLSPVDRQAVWLTKLAGYSMAEAGQQCGVSEGAMKVRVHRAINRLKKLLEHDGTTP